jgi:hypothetical protein
LIRTVEKVWDRSSRQHDDELAAVHDELHRLMTATPRKG